MTKYIPKYTGGAADSFAIQSVIVKKPTSLAEAKAKATHIVKKRKMLHREKATAFHFRNIPRTKFVKGTFRSKKINPSITLVFGELKPEFAHLRGAGIWDWVKEKASSVASMFKPKLDGFNNTSTKTLKDYGDKPIANMFLMRTPIQGMLNTALNVISLGKWNELRERFAFDKLYHLSLVVEVCNKKVIVEKNATVNINTNYQHASTSEIQHVPLAGKQLTLYQLVDAGRKSVGDTTFFKYNVFNENGGTNCQRFIQILLEASGLLTPAANTFLMQDVSKLKEELPGYVKDTAQVATDLGAIANRLTGGKHKDRMRSYVGRKMGAML